MEVCFIGASNFYWVSIHTILPAITHPPSTPRQRTNTKQKQKQTVPHADETKKPAMLPLVVDRFTSFSIFVLCGFCFLCMRCIHRPLYTVGPSCPQGARLTATGGRFLLYGEHCDFLQFVYVDVSVSAWLYLI
jgi:hypothetical protein